MIPDIKDCHVETVHNIKNFFWYMAIDQKKKLNNTKIDNVISIMSYLKDGACQLVSMDHQARTR